jgi:inner membrane protein
LSTCKEKKITPDQYFTTPAPFTSFLWYCVVAADGGFYIGYRSVFDRSRDMTLTFSRSKKYYWHPCRTAKMFSICFGSRGYYALHSYNDSLVFSDLRFGQQMGWQPTQGSLLFIIIWNIPDKIIF